MIENNKKKKIIITGGGTLGHILPILPVVYEIYEEYDLYFIGTTKGIEKKYFNDNNINQYFKKIYYLDMRGLNRKNIFKNIITIHKYIKTKKEAKKIIKNINPNLIIGMGGYISGVVIEQGIKNNIKTFIYEQNSILGLANRLLYKKVDKLLLSIDIKNIKSNNKVIIGNPRLNYVRNNYKINEKNFILIFGGSLGSEYINNLILDNSEYFNFENFKIKIVVGKKYYKNNIKKINALKQNNIIIYDFLNNILDEMSNASLIVSRAGASTISEILGLRKPAIIIPSPNVTGNHQYLNASILYKEGCCEMIEEKELTKEKLYLIINKILTNYKYKKEIITNIDNNYNKNSLQDFINMIGNEI